MCRFAAAAFALLPAHPAYAHDTRVYVQSESSSVLHGDCARLGEVQQIDREGATIVLRQAGESGPVTVRLFAVHPAILEDIRVGDRVGFRSEKKGDALIVTEIRRSRAP